MVKNSPPPVEFTPFNMDDVGAMQRLSEWSADPKEMLPLGPEAIARHHLSTAAYIDGELAGYCAISVIYSRFVVELGGLVVNPELRGRQVGTQLVKKVVGMAREELAPETILAFSNEKSSPVFKKLGGVVVEDVSSLPAEVWKLCHICPNYEEACAVGNMCCNRVIDITNIEM